jgi:hypothetical protein
MLSAAHLHRDTKVKKQAYTFIKANPDSVMKLDGDEAGGWTELIKNAELVNYIINNLFIDIDWD